MQIYVYLGIIAIVAIGFICVKVLMDFKLKKSPLIASNIELAGKFLLEVQEAKQEYFMVHWVQL